MSDFLYIPIPARQLVEFAHLWQECFVRFKLTPPRVLYNFSNEVLQTVWRTNGFGVLRDVTSQDRVFVVLHGDYLRDGDTIAAPRDDHYHKRRKRWIWRTMKTYDSRQLASVLRAEALSMDTEELILFDCYDRGFGQRLVDFHRFGQALQRELKMLGYSKISVRVNYGVRQM